MTPLFLVSARIPTPARPIRSLTTEYHCGFRDQNMSARIALRSTSSTAIFKGSPSPLLMERPPLRPRARATTHNSVHLAGRKGRSPLCDVRQFCSVDHSTKKSRQPTTRAHRLARPKFFRLVTSHVSRCRKLCPLCIARQAPDCATR